MIVAEYTGTNSLVCVPAVDDFTQVEYVDDASMSVLWSGLGVTYYLETEVDLLTGTICIRMYMQVLLFIIFLLTVILYNCSALAGVCSSCLSVSTLLSLGCGWCHDSGDCAVTELCPADSTFTADDGNSCPVPQITKVQYIWYL